MTPATTSQPAQERAPVCPQTGLAKPECHCPRCVRELIHRHRPHG